MSRETDLRTLIAAPHPDRAPLPPAADVGDGVRLLRGVPFADLPGVRPPELDLWLPRRRPDGPPAPLVIFVHGGGWRRGRREDMGYRMRGWEPGPFARIAAAGLAVASVDYRLSGEALFPAPLEDVRSALRWLVRRSPELGTDADRVVVWGESAGGHLAALLALSPGIPPVKGAVAWYAPSDLALQGDDPHTPEALLLGAAPADVPGPAREASPLAQVRPGAPPFLLVHGEDDSMVGCDHSRRLAARLGEVGAEVELHTVPGADHVWHGLPDDRVGEIFDLTLRWIQQRVA
ncbi:alpha/beta hydrolase fold domain-containing protein [Streptomyces sp. NPDC051315]|uniref:alpha/beta hydrolase fold domain-containing protein n=1 Tax=Streptomyces sp. NPDC051315 TaxID=3365650 RepID=UPI0037BD2B52